MRAGGRTEGSSRAELCAGPRRQPGAWIEGGHKMAAPPPVPAELQGWGRGRVMKGDAGASADARPLRPDGTVGIGPPAAPWLLPAALLFSLPFATQH